MNRFVKTVEVVSEVSGWSVGWLIFIMMLMILVEVLTRYILRSPLAIVDEFGGYILVAITYVGLAYTWKTRGHVRVEFLFNKLPMKLQKKLRVTMLILASIFSFGLIKASYELLSFSHQLGARSGSWLRIPLIWPQLVLMIGSIFLMLQLVAEVIKSIWNSPNVEVKS